MIMTTRKIRVIDERKQDYSKNYPSAFAARPFAIQDFDHGKWMTIPGAYYATMDEARNASKRFQPLQETAR